MNKEIATRKLATARAAYTNALLNSVDAQATRERAYDAADAAEADASDASTDEATAHTLKAEAAHAVTTAEKILAETEGVVPVAMHEALLKAGELCKTTFENALNASASIGGDRLDPPGMLQEVAAVYSVAISAAEDLVTELVGTAEEIIAERKFLSEEPPADQPPADQPVKRSSGMNTVFTKLYGKQ